MQFFEKLTEVSWYVWAVLAALLLASVVLLKVGKRQKFTVRMLAYAAMCIAVAFVLSNIRLFRMPQGGSITPFSKLPLVLFAVSFGVGPGMLVGFAYGLLELLSGPSIIHPLQFVVDYLLSYGMIAMAGFAARMPKENRFRLPTAALIGCLGHYAMTVISGAVFFAEYAPVGQSAWLYSLVYNMTYLGPDAALCIAVAFIPGIARIAEKMKG